MTILEFPLICQPTGKFNISNSTGDKSFPVLLIQAVGYPMLVFTFQLSLFSNCILGAEPILNGTSWKVCPNPSASVTKILTTPTVPASKFSGGLTSTVKLVVPPGLTNSPKSGMSIGQPWLALA